MSRASWLLALAVMVAAAALFAVGLWQYGAAGVLVVLVVVPVMAWRSGRQAPSATGYVEQETHLY